MKLLTQEQHDYLASIRIGRTTEECTEMLNKKFGLELKVSQIRSYAKNHKLPSGLKCWFKKGQVSYNKGVKMSEELRKKVSKTWFKKGHVPHNRVPVGTEVTDSDGYLKIKVAEPNVWQFKHRLVWEQYNGKIPAGKMINFINGDRRDCRIENLIMTDNQIHGYFNSNFRTKERPPELVAVVSDILQIKNKLKELTKK